MSGKAIPDTAGSRLHDFLRKVYDGSWLAECIGGRMLRKSQRLAALSPLRAHLTKDGRIVVACRAEVASNRSGEAGGLPVFVHFAVEGKSDGLKCYRGLDTPDPWGTAPTLKRNLVRAAQDELVTAFPLDPEVRALSQILRPSDLMAAVTGQLLPPGAKPAVSTSARLLGYRPERRAVFAVRAVGPDCGTHIAVLKCYRRGEADRVAGFAGSLKSTQSSEVSAAWPLAHDTALGAILYPFFAGETLQHLVETQLAAASDLEQTGRLLRAFQSPGGRRGGGHTLREFSFGDELAILERWRRLLKRGGSPYHGIVAGHLVLLRELGGRCAGEPAVLHRDFYPKQVIVEPYTRAQSIVDIDTVAWGPPAVDVGNFLAHLEAERPAGADSDAIACLRASFLRGYRVTPQEEDAVRVFEFSTSVRLLCLAIVAPFADSAVPYLIDRCRHLARSLG